MLLPRALTAIIGIPFLLLAIYFGHLPYLFLIMGIVLLGLREFYFLSSESGYPSFPFLGLIGGFLLVFSVFANGLSFGQVTENQGTPAVLSFILFVVIVRSLMRGPSDTSLSEWSVTLFGIIYVAWSLSYLLLIRDLQPQGQAATFLLFALIWSADIAAYVIGSRWGRHVIAPATSPKKTWEGTIAGILAAVVVALLFQKTLLKSSLSPLEAVILGSLTAVVAFVSDLGESMLKRGAGAKDSSPLLPGHGGILDRFDSFILSAPFFYYYWAFVKH